MHGQITGENLQSPRLEKDIRLLRDWIECLALGGEKSYGYDGIGRNTFVKARTTAAIAKVNYAFGTVREFKQWLDANTS
jgi:hypothetical protein